MNRKICFSILILLCTISIGIAIPAKSSFGSKDITKITIQKKDIPKGFVYGRLPDGVKRILKGNPWLLNRKAINFISKRIYPGGNSSEIKQIHMSILARKTTPFGDDIVCYVILYKDKMAAKKEAPKIFDYVRHNSDRAIAISQENLIIFIHADSTADFTLIKKLSVKMQKRINSL
jgi:hypothetical protein